MSSEISQKTSKSRKILYVIVVAFVVLVIIASLPSEKESSSESGSEVTSSTTESANNMKIGVTPRAGYFDVTVNNFSTKARINTSNKFTSLADPEGSVYAVLDVTFKSQDSEGRTILSTGELLIEVEGKRLTYDKSETIIEKGYGGLLEAVNSLMVFSTKLVYLIPANIHGRVYWQPYDGNPVFLGAL